MVTRGIPKSVMRIRVLPLALLLVIHARLLAEIIDDPPMLPSVTLVPASVLKDQLSLPMSNDRASPSWCQADRLINFRLDPTEAVIQSDGSVRYEIGGFFAWSQTPCPNSVHIEYGEWDLVNRVRLRITTSQAAWLITVYIDDFALELGRTDDPIWTRDPGRSSRIMRDITDLVLSPRSPDRDTARPKSFRQVLQSAGRHHIAIRLTPVAAIRTGFGIAELFVERDHPTPAPRDGHGCFGGYTYFVDAGSTVTPCYDPDCAPPAITIPYRPRKKPGQGN